MRGFATAYLCPGLSPIKRDFTLQIGPKSFKIASFLFLSALKNYGHFLALHRAKELSEALGLQH